MTKVVPMPRRSTATGSTEPLQADVVANVGPVDATPSTMNAVVVEDFIFVNGTDGNDNDVADSVEPNEPRLIPIIPCGSAQETEEVASNVVAGGSTATESDGKSSQADCDTKQSTSQNDGQKAADDQVACVAIARPELDMKEVEEVVSKMNHVERLSNLRKENLRLIKLTQLMMEDKVDLESKIESIADMYNTVNDRWKDFEPLLDEKVKQLNETVKEKRQADQCIASLSTKLEEIVVNADTKATQMMEEIENVKRDAEKQVAAAFMSQDAVKVAAEQDIAALRGKLEEVAVNAEMNAIHLMKELENVKRDAEKRVTAAIMDRDAGKVAAELDIVALKAQLDEFKVKADREATMWKVELEETMSRAERDVSSLKAEVESNKQQSTVDRNEEVKQLMAALQESENLSRHLMEDNQKLQTENDNFRRTISVQVQELSECYRNKNELKDALRKAESQCSPLQDRSDALREIRHLTIRNSNMEKALEDMLKNFDGAKHQEMEAVRKSERDQAEIIRLTDKLAEMEKLNQSLQGQMETIKRDSDSLANVDHHHDMYIHEFTRALDLEEALHVSTVQRTDLLRQADIKEAEIGQLKTLVQRLKREGETNVDSLNEIKVSTVQQNDEISKLKSNLERMDGELGQYISMSVDQSDLINDLREQIRSTGGDGRTIAELIGEKSKVEAQNRDLDAKVSLLTKELLKRNN